MIVRGGPSKKTYLLRNFKKITARDLLLSSLYDTKERAMEGCCAVSSDKEIKYDAPKLLLGLLRGRAKSITASVLHSNFCNTWTQSRI